MPRSAMSSPGAASRCALLGGDRQARRSRGHVVCSLRWAHRDAGGPMANRDNLNPGTSTSGLGSDWLTEEQYWRTNWTNRPYATADRGFDYYRPAYQYGYESAKRYRGRDWYDVDSDLRSGWDRVE